ncbi:MAG TPA: hypothetical protein VFQ65_34410, partial [Kofleriaceae bacterium]|nr:hypothetical protein [Kofleriaceae bacterium]
MTGLLNRQLRDFAIAGALAIVIASVAFVAVRNREVIERQFDLAGRSALAVAEDREPLPTVHGVLVGPSTASRAHPFLRHREVRDDGWRTLQASPLHPDDKLFYDAATRFDRDHQPFVELLRDGSGRAIAARAHGTQIAVAVTGPIAPAHEPLLVIIGVLGLGAALTAAGALVGGGAARVGAFAGIAALAIPTLLWASWFAAVAILLIALAVSQLQRAGLTDRLAAGLRSHRTAVSFLAPAGVAMLVLV